MDLIINNKDENRLTENKENESIFRQIVTQANDVIAFADTQGKVTYVNNKVTEMLGYKIEEIIGKSILDFGLKEDVETNIKKLENQKLGISEKFEIRLVSKDGNQVWGLISATSLYDKSGNYNGSIFIIIDITGQKEIKDLKEGEQLYKTLFENIDDAFAIIEPIYDNSNKVYDIKYKKVNDLYNKQLGFKGDDIIGKTAREAFPNVGSYSFDKYDKIINTGKSVHFKQYNKDTNMWYGGVAFPYNKGHIGVLFNDISERIRHENELIKEKEELTRKAEDKYYKLFNTMNEGFCIVEVIFDNDNKASDLKYIEINPAFMAQLGLKGIEVQGKTSRELKFNTEDYWYEVYSKVALTGEPVQFINEAKEFNGFYIVNAFKIGEPEDRYIAVLFNDITEEVMAKKQMEKTIQIQEEVFVNVSHELKTPLSVIYSANQLMEMYFKNKSLDENRDKIFDSINIIKQNCYRFMKLINNIIDSSKVKAGFLKLQLSNENIVSVVEGIVESVSEYIKRKSIDIIFDTNTEEKIIVCDVNKIERIMLNLISNAVKFSNTGSSIYVNVLDKDDTVEISVRDTGIGIDKENLYKIFNRFHQVDKSLSRNAEGTGIGLDLVKSFVEMHGGKISVDSEVGKGTIFIIELPSRTIDEDEVAKDKINTIDSKIEIINIEFSDIYSI